jgi:hypothetical protein
MMNLTNSLYAKFYYKIFDYKNKYNLETYVDSEKKNIYNKPFNEKNIKNNITNYMIKSNNKASKLYNKLNLSNLLISEILRYKSDIEYDHNNETIICNANQYNNIIKKNRVEIVLVFIFGVLAHFYF